MGTLMMGTDVHLFLGSGSTKLGFSKSLSLSFGGSPIDISNKDTGGYDDSVMGRLNWSAKSDCMLSYDADYGFITALKAHKNRDKVKIVVGSATAEGASDNTKFSIDGFMSIEGIEVTYNDGDVATFSISLTGKGEYNINEI
ncbi:hypothetical protein E9993_01620 [Labilibacter sediminis]|nr:hypothetical protein E9993_01620 [Labilibacter sediminis]